MGLEHSDAIRLEGVRSSTIKQWNFGNNDSHAEFYIAGPTEDLDVVTTP